MSPNNSTIYPHATWKSTSFSLHLTQFLAKKTKKIAVIKKKTDAVFPPLHQVMGGEARHQQIQASAQGEH